MLLAACDDPGTVGSSIWPDLLILAPLIFILGIEPWRRYRARTRGQLPYQSSLRHFFEQTRYRLLGMEDLPAEAQADIVANAWQNPAQAPEGPITPRPYTRDLGGDRLVYYHRGVGASNPWGAPLGQSAWVLHLREPVRAPWSLREKNASLRLLRAALSRDWFQRFDPGLPRAQLPDPRLNARFAIHADELAAANATLADPEIREALLACPDLDLHVQEDRIVFLDPRCKNLGSGMGGMMTGLMLAQDPDAYMALLTMAHERILDLLAAIARASRGGA
jgi:hypothetical protein